MASKVSKTNRQVPQCARCRSHNTLSSVRGHKRLCKWRDCTCAKCKTVDEKRRVTAVRVAVLRRERKKRMAHKINFENFQLGGNGAWGMMGGMPGGYTAEQYLGNRSMLVPNDTFTNEVFHMQYPAMHPYENEYFQFPGAGGPHWEEPRNQNEAPKAKDGDITKNLANFQHEYNSLMRQKNEEQTRDVLRGNGADENISRNSAPGFYPNAPQRMYAPQSSTTFYIRGPSVSGAPYQSPVPQKPRRFVPMVINAPGLPLPFPVSPNHAIPYRVGF